MIIIFKDNDLEELLKTGKNRKYKEISKDKKLFDRLIRLYEIMTGADDIRDISVYSYLHYEKLKHNLAGVSSVRPFGNQRVERLLFIEEDDKITIEILELDNTHYGNKK
ncbi:MAG: type II toxin-antitoxin system RelE/ParE family toxin [Bacteroidales bacterium]|nr:type II toxin-antitoxin system RelE/ParE family toxin [Bacteroidales bacterium]